VKIFVVCVFLTVVAFSFFPEWDMIKKVLLFWLVGGPILASVAFLMAVGRKPRMFEDQSRHASGWYQNEKADGRFSSKNAPYVLELAKYYRDFLETSFHKRKEPKRAIRYRHQKNHLLGFNAKKYGTFAEVVWSTIQQGFPATEELTITKGKFTSKIPGQLQKLLHKQIEGVSEETIQEIEAKAVSAIRQAAESNRHNPLDAYDGALAEIGQVIKEVLVKPFLSPVAGALNTKSSWEEDSRQVVEESLTESLFFPLREEIPELVNSVLAGDRVDVRARLAGLFNQDFAKSTIATFFADLSINDLYMEIQELMRNVRLLEEQEIYLYFGDITFNNNKYPIFYIPVHLEKFKDSITVSFDSTAFINKKAIDYIVQEFKKDREKSGAPDQVSDRILYLEDAREDFANKLQHILIDLLDFFELPHDLQVEKGPRQLAKGDKVSLSTACHICIFDKSDESIINDYEEILESLKTNEQVSGSLFRSFVTRFVEEDPRSVNEAVEKDWENLETSAKLVYKSPIPLNEEQRKILIALQKKECHFLAVQGPPGTGKSHTITAILCDAILRGDSVLVLSDKKEALDVVEEKVTEVINAIRPGDDFQNPILRLGNSGNTYTKILSPAAMGGIEEHFRASQRNEEEREEQIRGLEQNLKSTLQALCEGYGHIQFPKLQELYALEHELKKRGRLSVDVDELTNKSDGIEQITTLKVQFDWFGNTFGKKGAFTNLRHLMGELGVSEISRDAIEEFIAYAGIAQDLEIEIAAETKRKHLLKGLALFQQFSTSQFGLLEDHIRECDSLKGMLFANVRRREDVKKLTDSFLQVFSTTMRKSILENYESLNASFEVFQKAMERKAANAVESRVELDFLRTIHWLLVDPTNRCQRLDLNLLRRFLNLIQEFEAQFPKTSAGLGICSKDGHSYFENKLSSLGESDLASLIRYLSLYEELKEQFLGLPECDFLGAKRQLENLVTEAMAHKMDGKAVKFFHESKATAQALRSILRKKHKFPREDFQKLKSAFPCIIAGIRDFSDYIPLDVGIFDYVIIDEASQVSVAQALPAIVRGSKVIVLGDSKQFSNLQSGMAKGEINQEYLQKIEEVCKRVTKGKGSQLERIKKLNIKTSVLELFESISNYQITLLKHSRGYREHISYSSKHFYNGRLQALKMRVKPVEEVLKFTVVEYDGSKEKVKNTNRAEIDFIKTELKNFKKNGTGGTIGIITPFHDQQTRLIDEINQLPERDYFFEQRKLKIMTFDTCQGEERDTVFYSMVATRGDDKLNYIFPRDLNLSFYEEEEGKVKVQRLNVGFSRAKECMHFVVSKPLEEFKGGIGGALFHFWNALEEGRQTFAPDLSDLGRTMELTVLDWIQRTNLVQQHASTIELTPHFPIGDYLKQLEKTYEQPAYRTDFLLRVIAPNGQESKIIIEYDDFQQLLKGQREENCKNQDYYSDKDVEREKTLESYGYQFLRINRFNLGHDPITTLDQRLAELLGCSSPEESLVGA